MEFAGRGGLIHYAFQLCRALAARGADVTLVTDRHYELEALHHDFPVVKLLRLWDPKPAAGPTRGIWHKLRRVGRAVIYYREWLRLARWLRTQRFDVVQLGDMRFPGDLVCLYLLRALGVRIADVCHNVHPFALSGGASGGFRRSRLDRALYRRVYRQFEHVFVHFESNRALFLRTFDVPAARVTCIPHGNEEIFAELRDPRIDASALRNSLELESEAPVVLFFGSLAHYKGVDLLIEAFANVVRDVSTARLVIIGLPLAGFDVDMHRVLAQRFGVAGAVRLIPRYVPTGEVAGWMALAAVAVLPYREVYQSGALATATTFGVPVVATRVGAMSDVVTDGETGLLVPPGDVPALADAITRLITDPALARRLGTRAADDARRVFSWDRVAAAMLRAYRGLERVPNGHADPRDPGGRHAVVGEGA